MSCDTPDGGSGGAPVPPGARMVQCVKFGNELPGLDWQPTDPRTQRTMVWDNRCRMVDDPEGEARKILLT